MKEENKFHQLKITCNQIVVDENMPMNLRVNSATLLAFISKFYNTQVELKRNPEHINNINNVVLYIGTLKSYKVGEVHKHAVELHNIINIIEEAIIFYINAPKVLMYIARAFYHIAQIMLETPPNHHEQLKLMKANLSTFINFALAFLEHDVEVIRYICRDILRCVITTFNSLKLKYFLNKIFNIVKSNALSMSVRCLILQQSTAIVGVKTIINKCPFIFSEVFPNNLGRDTAVTDLFQCKYDI